MPRPHGHPNRFVLVRADGARILTCALEEQAEHVAVHDLLHERGDAGWSLSVSSYRKVRLSAEIARAAAADAGLEIAFTDVDKGLVTVAARAGPCRDGCNGPAIGWT